MTESLEAQLQATLNMIPAYTWYAAPSGALTFVNERFADYLGLAKDHPLRFGTDTGAAWDSHIPLLHPDDHEETRRVWSTCLSTGCAGEVSFRVRAAQGNYRWFLSRTEPLRANDGTVRYWIGINLDIEERKQAEFYLAQGQRLAHTGSWAFNAAGFDYWSPELFAIHGLDPGGKAPTIAEYLALVHPEDREFVSQAIQKMFAEGGRFDFTKRIVRPDGKIRSVRCVGVPRTHGETLLGFVGTGIDVTEQEQLTQELQRREAYLAEAQRLSHTGSFGWRPSTGEIFWSEETFRIFEYDSTMKPTVELVLQRVHPEDVAVVERIIESSLRDGKDFDFEHRLLMPDGSVKHLHVCSHAVQAEPGNVEFVGAVVDISAAKQAEERIRLIIDTSPGMLWSAGPDGSVDFISQRCLDYTGMTLEQSVGWSWERVIHPDDREQLVSKWRAAVAEGTPHEMVHRVRRFDGEYRWCLSQANPLFDRTGRVLGWSGNEIEIHQIKQAEESLRQSEAYLAEAQRLSKTGSWAWSPEQDIRYWSEECYRVLGFDPKDGLPRKEDYFQRIHPDDQPGFRELIQTAIREKSEWQADYRIVHPDGPVRDIHVVGHPVLSTSGHLVEFVGTVIDLTERKRAEEELRRSEMELRQMLDFAPQLIAVYGPNRERLYANRVALDYLGLSLEEWWQTQAPGAFIHPDDRERELAYFARARSNGSADQLELRLRKGDGSYRWFLTRYNSVRDNNGQILRWHVSLTDIEDRKRAEERLQRENVALREEIDRASMFEEIVGTAPALQAVLSRISKVAPTGSTVLITGETGTGKELVARAIHRRSHRASRAFVGVNCAAIPPDLIASELFGHEKGAFTGAMQRRVGRFELAEGGTIFLDEVGELLPDTQVALLRVLQEREFERVGGTQPIHVDVRVIAATNCDLKAAVATGTFRQDLYYRLNVFPLEMPPLRERRKDIPVLVEYFIGRYARKAGKTFRRVSKRTLDRLQSYPWPGNVRELQNVIERSVIVSDGDELTVDESWLSAGPPVESRLGLSGALAAQEKAIIEDALRASVGRVFGPSGAAARLGIPRSTLESKIRALKISKSRFRTPMPKRS